MLFALLAALGSCVGKRELRLTLHTLSAEADASCRATAASLCARTEACSAPLLAFFFETRARCEREVVERCARFYEGPGSSAAPAPCDASAMSCALVKDLVALRGVSLRGENQDAAFLFGLCSPPPGRHLAGEPCITHGDCSTSVCENNRGPGCGRCAPARREGDLCADGAACPAPLQCSGSRCIRLRTYGEKCSDRSECAASVCLFGRCVQGGTTAGTPCSVDTFCDLAAGLVCAPDRTCHPLHIVGDGEACDGVLVLEPDARSCAGYADATCDGTCRHAREPKTCSDDAACPNAQCVNGHCARSCSEIQ